MGLLSDYLVGRNLKKILGFRGDASPAAPMYYAETWPDLLAEPFSFPSCGVTLQGYVYRKKGNDHPRGAMAAYHGIGGGHFSYMSVIDFCAENGFLVYAYDNLGSGLSEGHAIENLSYADLSQKDFYAFLDQDPRAKGLKRYSIGHSWGGHAALASLRPEFGVSNVISFAGFDSVPRLYGGYAPKFAKMVYSYQRHAFGEVGVLSALTLMKETKAQVLYVQGDQDKLVPYEDNGLRFQKELADRSNIHFLIRKGSNHQCFWDQKTEKYYLEEIVDKKKGVNSLTRDLDRSFRDDLLRTIDPEVRQAMRDFWDR